MNARHYTPINCSLKGRVAGDIRLILALRRKEPHAHSEQDTDNEPDEDGVTVLPLESAPNDSPISNTLLKLGLYHTRSPLCCSLFKDYIRRFYFPTSPPQPAWTSRAPRSWRDDECHVMAIRALICHI